MKCEQCGINFEYFPGEVEAYSEFQVPPSKNCADCRKRRRMSFRNERNLYHNKSFKSGKQIITLYPPDTPFKIIDQDEWWDDSFDASEYGRDFDFSRPFFDQFKELQRDVPRWSRIFMTCENSDFTNNCANVRNSYLAFSCHDSENIYYGVRVNRSNSCMDCYNLSACEYCSNCTDCNKCYDTHHSQSSENCNNGYYLFDCHSCSDCILCAGLRNAQYMILNKQYSKEDYEKYKEEFFQRMWIDQEKIEEMHREIKAKTPHRDVDILNSEGCSGNFIVNSKGVINGFNISDSEDCINAFNSDRLKSCYDNQYNDKSELCIECDTCYEVYNCKFSTYFVGCKNVQYCDQSFFIEDCFGCIGLKRRKNMILNKEYSSSDYKIMLNKLRDHMKRTGEYGKPFPSTLSAFAYNETVAQEEYPLIKEEAEKEGYFWHEDIREAEHFGKVYKIPTDHNDIEESICERILTCESTGKNYKIIPQEYTFYKKLNLPLPRKCPDQRYKDLLALRTNEHLRDENCSHCKKKIKTTYKKGVPFEILCQDCYLKTAY